MEQVRAKPASKGLLGYGRDFFPPNRGWVIKEGRSEVLAEVRLTNPHPVGLYFINFPQLEGIWIK